MTPKFYTEDLRIKEIDYEIGKLRAKKEDIDYDLELGKVTITDIFYHLLHLSRNRTKIRDLKNEIAFLNTAKKEKEGFDPTLFTPIDNNTGSQGVEVLRYGGIEKRYDSIDLSKILSAIRSEPSVRICKREYRTYEGTPQGTNEWVNDNSSVFEYPYWYNHEFDEGSENHENARANQIKLTPSLVARLFGAVTKRNMDQTLEYCKERLKDKIGAKPIAEGKWGLQYLEKVEDLGTGRHLVRETDVIFSPQYKFYYSVPSGPF